MACATRRFSGKRPNAPGWFKRNVPSAGSEGARTVGVWGLGPQKTQGRPATPRWKEDTASLSR